MAQGPNSYRGGPQGQYPGGGGRGALIPGIPGLPLPGMMVPGALAVPPGMMRYFLTHSLHLSPPSPPSFPLPLVYFLFV